MEGLCPLGFRQLGHGDTGPARYDPCYLFIGNIFMYQASLSVLNGLLFRFKRALKPRDDIILQFTGARIITLALGYRKFVSGILDLLPEFLQFLDGFLLILPLRHPVRKFFRFIGKLPVKCFEPVDAQPVIFLFERFSLYLKLCHLTVQFIKLRRHGIKFSLYQCTCLVNKVDGLIRQEPVGNISMAQHRSRYESRIRYLYVVEILIPFL